MAAGATSPTEHSPSSSASSEPGRPVARISHGFTGRRGESVDPARVPPGQYVNDDFPVLSAGPTPHHPLDWWSFTIQGAVDEQRSWSWEELQALPSETVTKDIHCVTKWSKLDTVWTGVSLDVLLDGVEMSAEYVMAFSDGGYTTNLPLDDVTGGKAWGAFAYGGGAPARAGARSPTGGSRSSPSPGARHGCPSRPSTSGRAPSGCAGSTYAR